MGTGAVLEEGQSGVSWTVQRAECFQQEEQGGGPAGRASGQLLLTAFTSVKWGEGGGRSLCNLDDLKDRKVPVLVLQAWMCAAQPSPGLGPSGLGGSRRPRPSSSAQPRSSPGPFPSPPATHAHVQMSPFHQDTVTLD